MTSDAKEITVQPSAEMIAKLTESANKLVWKKPDLNVLRPELSGQYSPLVQTIEGHIKHSDKRRKLLLPDLRAFNNETVGVFTDYGGESKESRYLTYSTLVCGWNLSHPFLEMMKVVRQHNGLGTKEIEFKDFRMGQVRRSLPGYLAALNVLPGFLLTLAIDKRLTSLFGPESKATREFIAKTLRETDLGERKPEVNEKLLRVVHIAAYLTGLLAHDGHKIFWMTDHDPISATPEMHQKTLALFERVLGLYARKGHTFPLLGGALPFPERSVHTLDLLSATDIVAGSLDQYLTQRDSVPLEDIQVKEGCDVVLQWLAHDGIGLKKMNVVLQPGRKNIIHAATLEFELNNLPANATVIPISVG